MMKLYALKILGLLMLLLALDAKAQTLIPHAEPGDVIAQDSLSIVLSSVYITKGKDTLQDAFRIDQPTATIFATRSLDSVELIYTTYPINLYEEYYHKDTSLIQKKSSLLTPINTYEVKAERQEPIFFEGLNKSGSLSRGITVGNNQDAVLNSNLNLQLSGRINPTTTIKASITDNQIPVYAEGISQSLQEFDRVFIEVENEQFGKVQAGDFDIGPSGHYFLRFQKRISGAGIQSPIKLKNGTLSITGVGALARGEFHRNTFRGTDGNQGPYKLRGKNNELVILVISGSERVYIDGNLLVRGLDHDYTIDYTTGEVTFTALRPITKDHRIVVEFQYTVQNFTRSIGYGGVNWRNEKWEQSFFLYSEQDAKNQPIRPLTDDDKRILANAGDDPLKAVTPSWQQREFDANRILYAIKDSLGFDTVFVFSTDPNDTLFEVAFSYVGTNNGNYIPTETAANGIVYQFVPPIAGVPQGTHIPYSLLPRPEQIQVATYKGAFRDKTQNINWEGAYSKNDPNRFSEIDNENHQGFAGKLGYAKSWGKQKWKHTLGAQGEHTSENFSTVERIRNVEFSRDWNIQANPNSALSLGGLNYQAQKSNAVRLSLQSNAIQMGNSYTGWKNSGRLFINENGWFTNIWISYLNTQDSSYTTEFLRQKSKIQKNFKNKLYLGGQSESESNTASIVNETNLLNYRFFDYYVYTGFGDTAESYIEGGYFNRTDDTIRTQDWQQAAFAQGARLKANYRNQNIGNIGVYGQYRILNNYTDGTRLNSITARIQYNNRFFKNFLAWNTFYEANMGSEPRRNYKYLKVPKGSGTHIWVDYNGNGLEELDEFEPAPFPDQGEYIRIFVISREYLPVSNLRFTQQLDFNFYNLKGIRGTDKFLGKFNLQTYYLLNRKELLTSETNNLNPFQRDILDSLIIQQLETFRSTLFFNRRSAIYGADYTFQQNSAKNLLSFGLENNRVREHSLNFRYIIKKKTTLRLTGKHINKINGVPDFPSRNYDINTRWLKPSASYQPGKYFRLTADYTLENSINNGSELAEKLDAQKAGIEMSLNHPKIATFLTRFDWVDNRFEGNPFSPVGFEMLKGLSPGTNYLWQVSLQKNITSFLQVVLNYNGRTSENSPTIHTGTVQVKAFF
jgi:hypothetical protein